MIPRYHTTTALLLRIACMPLPFLLISCVPSIPPLPGASTGQSMRVGEFPILSPSETQKKYGCKSSREIQFGLGQTTLHPERVQPRGRINQMLYYYICSPSINDTLQVQVTRILYFSKKEITRDVEYNKVKSGTWARSVILHLPANSESGQYVLETWVSYQSKTEKRSASFYVEQPSDKR
jgi:hypothetical protein